MQTITYFYDTNGVRVETSFIAKGTQILAMKQKNKMLIFRYVLNKLIGFNYNDGSSTNEYLYHRNIQGDIIGIYDDQGNKIGGYAYDAYGNRVITEDQDGIASLNPFRYRGYFCDEETKLYYLNSRYYDPETGRFISPDTLSILDETRGQVNGLNLYMYCGDNPIMRVDPTGKEWYDIFAWIGVGLFTVALTIVTLGAAGIAIGGIADGIIMGAAIGTLTLGTVGAAIGAVGGMIYDAANGNSFGTSIWSWTKAGFGIGAIAGAVIGGAIGGLAGASLTGSSNLMLWTGLGKEGASIAGSEASKLGLKTISQTFGGRLINLFPKVISKKMWIWASKLAVTTAQMKAVTVLTGATIFSGSVCNV